jgi:(1->4)-alpha-D-glucan 1-alpha-D-glucosylmutase
MQDEQVFQATHRLVLGMMAEGKVNGLRLDHPDGLYDPAQYFDRLSRSLAAATDKTSNELQNSACSELHYVVIEKILTGDERLPGEWAVRGTTGYDFANLVNGLFVDSAASTKIDRIYRNFIDDDTDFEELAYRSRKLIMRVALASELNVLANRLTRIALSKRRTCDFTLNSLRDALMEVVASFPVYRTYVTPSGISESDERYIRNAIAHAKWRSPAADTTIFDFIEQVLLTRIAEGQDAAYRNAVTTFAMKFQQFTSPVMAKGIEDTVFYRYNRLVSLNEVGSDPQHFGISTANFHLANQERLRSWPHTMLATSTHDSKRSEDVRARINVLSEIPGLWRLRLREWHQLNLEHKRQVNNSPAPSANDEYLLYQTLLGAWPAEPLRDDSQWEVFRQRIESYMLKALREAKENTSWINQNAEYEGAISFFVKTLLTPNDENKFLADFVPFQRGIARIGLWNSLSQTLLKLTCPGVPDVYQGNELWSFDLVDPDNRRPVDYTLREQSFEALRGLDSLPNGRSVRTLLQGPGEGRLKLYVIWKTLCLRQQHSDLFENGDYLPATVEGTKANHVVAFLRIYERKRVLIVVPRLAAGLLNDSDLPPIGSQVWGDTRLILPAGAAYNLSRNIFTEEEFDLKAPINISKVLAEFPVAACVLK